MQSIDPTSVQLDLRRRLPREQAPRRWFGRGSLSKRTAQAGGLNESNRCAIAASTKAGFKGNKLSKTYTALIETTEAQMISRARLAVQAVVATGSADTPPRQSLHSRKSASPAAGVH